MSLSDLSKRYQSAELPQVVLADDIDAGRGERATDHASVV